MRQVVAMGLLVLGVCMASPSPADAQSSEGSPAYFEPTRILSRTDADRLLGNSGMTLQWISWDYQGPVSVRPDEHGVWMLTGSQTGRDGGEVRVDGRIVEIGDGYFTLRGTVSIEDTPDRGRSCRESKIWHFAVTQNRRYYRLREFEWCDGLTDYVDIYF